MRKRYIDEELSMMDKQMKLDIICEKFAINVLMIIFIITILFIGAFVGFYKQNYCK